MSAFTTVNVLLDLWLTWRNLASTARSVHDAFVSLLVLWTTTRAPNIGILEIGKDVDGSTLFRRSHPAWIIAAPQNFTGRTL